MIDDQITMFYFLFLFLFFFHFDINPTAEIYILSGRPHHIIRPPISQIYTFTFHLPLTLLSSQFYLLYPNLFLYATIFK